MLKSGTEKILSDALVEFQMNAWERKNISVDSNGVFRVYDTIKVDGVWNKYECKIWLKDKIDHEIKFSRYTDNRSWVHKLLGFKANFNSIPQWSLTVVVDEFRNKANIDRINDLIRIGDAIYQSKFMSDVDADVYENMKGFTCYDSKNIAPMPPVKPPASMTPSPTVTITPTPTPTVTATPPIMTPPASPTAPIK